MYIYPAEARVSERLVLDWQHCPGRLQNLQKVEQVEHPWRKLVVGGWVS